MAISNEDIQRVRDATDIITLFSERVPLRQRGREYWCCCPFHNEKTPSCKIDPSSQLWHCFGCGEGGDIFSFIMKAEDLSFLDAIRMLAERAHIDIIETGNQSVPQSRKARLREICRETQEFYHYQLMRGKFPDAAAARTYLGSRGFGSAIAKKWHLGFAPGHQVLVRHLAVLGFKPEEMIEANVAVQREKAQLRDRFFNRVMFPIHNPQGECIAFGGRVIGNGEPKYLNSQDTPLFHKSNVLYGLEKSKAEMTNTGIAIVVEGYTDVITLHESGITNVVATLGTALTLQHIRLLSRHVSKRIVYLFDGDAAGQRASERALQFINQDMTPEAGKARIGLYAVTLPDDLDPADFVTKRGAEALRELISAAKPLVQYGIDRRLALYDLSSAENRTRALSDALAVLAPIKESLLAKDYAVQIAGRLQMRESDVLSALSDLRFSRSYDNETKTSKLVAAVPSLDISQAEKNRLNCERQLLSLLAQNPPIALEHANTLSQTQWHNSAHRKLADSMLIMLESEPTVSAAHLVSVASSAVPQGASILTSGRIESNQLISTVTFLVEELEIGDLESTLASMNAQLKTDDSLSEEERNLFFAMVVDLQKTVAAKRAAHLPNI